MSYHTIPGPGDQCACGSYYACRCQPEPDLDAYYEASYQAGFEACEADGYSERPLNEWVYETHHRARWCPAERRIVYAMTPARYGELTWRHYHATEWAYALWFERQYGFDLGGYLAGYDDAGAGLPSAVCDPDRHRICSEAMDAFEPEPVLYGGPIGPCPAPSDTDDGLPF